MTRLNLPNRELFILDPLGVEGDRGELAGQEFGVLAAQGEGEAGARQEDHRRQIEVLLDELPEGLVRQDQP